MSWVDADDGGLGRARARRVGDEAGPRTRVSRPVKGSSRRSVFAACAEGGAGYGEALGPRPPESSWGRLGMRSFEGGRLFMASSTSEGFFSPDGQGSVPSRGRG